MSSPVDISPTPRAAPSDALRSVVARDRAVSAPRACNHSRKSRPRRSSTNAVSNFASTDVRKAHPLLEQKGLNAGSRDFPGERISPRQLSLRSRSEILDLPKPRRRSKYLPADSQKRTLLKRFPPLFRTRVDSPGRKSAERQRLSTCRQPPPSPFQGYEMLAWLAQERCLRQQCSFVCPKPFDQR